MAYTPNIWVDRVAAGDNKFIDQNGNRYTFTPNPDSVATVGTAFSADWMNHLEQGVARIGKLLWNGTLVVNESIALSELEDYHLILIMLSTGWGVGVVYTDNGNISFLGSPVAPFASSQTIIQGSLQNSNGMYTFNKLSMGTYSNYGNIINTSYSASITAIYGLF